VVKQAGFPVQPLILTVQPPCNAFGFNKLIPGNPDGNFYGLRFE